MFTRLVTKIVACSSEYIFHSRQYNMWLSFTEASLARKWLISLVLIWRTVAEDGICCSVTKLCPALCKPMNCSKPDFSVHHCFPEFAQTHVHWVSDAIQPPHPLLPPSLTLCFSQHQGLFQWPVLRIRWPKYWSFSFSINPSNEYSGLISFRID